MAVEINMDDIAIKEVTLENLTEEHICCAIGNDKTNKARAQQKKEWLKSRFDKGHRFLKADLRGKVFIEYSPAEVSIFPVEAQGYALIQCFWVSGRYKGHGIGRKLYDQCEKDCRKAGYRGIVAVTTPKKKPFMVDKKVLTHFGFQVCDEAVPFYQLVVKKFDNSAREPRFADTARRGMLQNARGLDFFYSPACPYNEDFTNIMADIGRELGFSVQIKRLETREDLTLLPIPWGLFSVFLDGKMLSAEVMVANKFRALLESKRPS
jgi:GNAT superfamily N-acetyltransferase